MTSSLPRRITAALVWVAAFCAASGVFLSVALLLRRLPPTEPVAVGIVTIERYSKLADYATAALFFLLVPPLTVWVQGRLGRAAGRRGFAEAMLLVLPWTAAPFFYLMTGKVGWVLLLPAALSLAGPAALRFFRGRLWVREMFAPAEGAWHALIFCGASGWLLFRYLVTGRTIAHVQTLLLEVVFVALFYAVFWAAVITSARVAELASGVPATATFRRISLSLLPVALLPLVAVVKVPLPQPRLFVAGAMVLSAALFSLGRIPSARTARNLAAWFVLPALIYLFSYASTAELSQWVDLFHRGEAIGPASDYLRGRTPYADVLPLHGLLEDGQLDAWLMQFFGRSLEVALARTVVIGALLGTAIWYLGMAVFQSIPLALLSVAMGSWTTAENNRTFFQVAAVALFWSALTRRRRMPAFLSGVFAGVAVFFSYDIGLYTMAGAFATLAVLAFVSRRVPWEGLPLGSAAVWFTAGAAAGAAPFLAYLAVRGALDDFAVTSFFTIPRAIDAVWSLPFPDLVSGFRNSQFLDALADFVLKEKFHLIVSPLTIAVAAVYLVVRWRGRRMERFDYALLVLGVFALIAQRSAFGRAEFRHQYFAAFLIGPMLVLLAIIALKTWRTLWDEGDAGTRAFLGAVVVVVVPAAALLFWIPDLVNARLHDLTRYTARVLRVDRDPHAEEVRWRIDSVSAAIQELSPKGQPVFDFSNQPAFYFFANRPNPTRFYQVPILSPAPLQAEAIAAIERAKTAVIIRRSPELFDQFDGVTNELRAQALAAYIEDVYELRRSLRGVELWTRRSGVKPRPVQAYLELLRLPSEKELVSGGIARILFPAVGSLQGRGGSMWQSDLTLHNPFRDPIAVNLRLSAGEHGRDRRVTLAPHQTVRWPDVVVSLFGVRDRVGTLWIEHREGRAPVAVVKTWDVAHDARASLERPLTMRDAATAGSPLPELAIIGVPETTPGRRVNVGMVNVGRIPATYRVSVRTRAGRQVGRDVESGVAEEQLWLVNDVEQELGVRLDETMTVRVEVIAGSGVAWATVVTGNGDAEIIPASPAEQR